MAKKKPSYYELLQHPKWQEKRLVIMNRAGFKCEWCLVEDRKLNVHHTYYEKDAKPWEYPDGSLLCLCDPCHRSAHEISDHSKRLISSIAARHGTELGLHRLTGYMEAMSVDQGLQREPRAAWIDVLPGEEQGVADYFQLTWEEVYQSVEDGGVDAWELRKLAKEKNRSDG